MFVRACTGGVRLPVGQTLAFKRGAAVAEMRVAGTAKPHGNKGHIMGLLAPPLCQLRARHLEHPYRYQPPLDQQRPLSNWKCSVAQPKRVSAMRKQVHLDGNASRLQGFKIDQ